MVLAARDQTQRNSDAECHKQRKRREITQASVAVADTTAADATVGKVRDMDYENDHYASKPHNFAEAFLSTAEKDNASKQASAEC